MHGSTAPTRPRISGAIYDNTLFGGRVRITAFGRFYNNEEQDWTLRHLQKPGDGEVDCSITRHLPTIARELGVQEVLAPSPIDFNGRTCRQNELTVHVRVGERLVIRRGARADGCRVLPRQAYVVSSGGCMNILGWYPGERKTGEKIKLDAAHAGLFSLVDKHEIETGETSREPASIVGSMLRSLNCVGKKASRRKLLQVVLAFPIPWQEFTHPWKDERFGEKNKHLCEFLERKCGKECLPGEKEQGCIDLVEIATQQFVDFGIPIENIRLIQTSDLFGVNNSEEWYSTRSKHPERRNLVIITRYD